MKTCCTAYRLTFGPINTCWNINSNYTHTHDEQVKMTCYSEEEKIKKFVEALATISGGCCAKHEHIHEDEHFHEDEHDHSRACIAMSKMFIPAIFSLMFLQLF